MKHADLVAARDLETGGDGVCVPSGTSRPSIPVTVIRPTIMAPTITTVTRPCAGDSITIATRRFVENSEGTWRSPIELTGYKSPGSERTSVILPATGACTRW